MNPQINTNSIPALRLEIKRIEQKEKLFTITNVEENSISFNDGSCASDKILYVDAIEFPYGFVTIDQLKQPEQEKYILAHLNEAVCEDRSLCTCNRDFLEYLVSER